MLRKIINSIILFMIIINVAGCWDSHDIERLSFPYAGAFDVYKGSDSTTDLREQNKVDITVLDPNLSPRAKEKAAVQTLSAASIAYARDKRAYITPETYFPGMTQVILIGEDLARQGLNKYFDSLFRIAVINNNMNLAVVEGRGEDIIKIKPDDYETMGVQLRAMLRDSEQKTFIPSTTLNQFQINVSPGKNPIIPLIKKSDNNVVFSGAAVFKQDHMVAKLNDLETRLMVILRGIKSQGSVPYFIVSDGDVSDAGTVHLTNNRKVQVTRDGDSYTFLINIHLDGEIAENIDKQPITEQKLGQIEKTVASDITGDLQTFIDKMQNDIQVDCIDISKYAMAKWRKELKNKINQDFIQQARIQVQVDVKLRNTGELQ